jgi:hypothetical protein
MKRLALPVLLAFGLLAQIAGAQTSSSTPVIGYYKFDVPSGTTAWNCAFVTKKDFQGAATSITAGTPNSTIAVTGTPFTAGAFNLHYVEILSGARTGLILDVVSNTTSQIVVEGNSTALGLTGTETFCVRKHATLSTVFANGGGLAPVDDTVEVFSDTGSSILAAYDGAQWVDAVDFVTPRNPIIYPGQGFKISSLAGSTVTFGGNEVSYVKTGPTKIPVFSGVINLVGVINPLVSTTPPAPGDVATLSQLGFESLAPVDDLVTVFSTNGVFSENIFVHDGSQVVDGVDFVTPKGTVPVRNGQAFQISPLSDGLYTQPQLVP